MLKRIYEWSGTWTGTIVIVLSIIFFLAQAFVIPSGSMKNTLLVGDMLFVKKFSYGIPIPTIPWIELKILPDFNNNGHLIDGDRPKRGDIVVFRYPGNDKIHYVKRCVATGDDLVALIDKHLFIRPKEGDNYIKKHYPKYSIVKILNKLWVKDPYRAKHPGIHSDPSVQRTNTPYPQLFDMMPIQVPSGEFFMMGDNRDHSNDSRFWGTVPYKNIVGTPWFLYFSWNSDKKIRWDRVFRTVEDLENNKMYIDNKTHQKGIY
jgi:signal peptidase I